MASVNGNCHYLQISHFIYIYAGNNRTRNSGSLSLGKTADGNRFFICIIISRIIFQKILSCNQHRSSGKAFLFYPRLPSDCGVVSSSSCPPVCRILYRNNVIVNRLSTHDLLLLHSPDMLLPALLPSFSASSSEHILTISKY